MVVVVVVVAAAAVMLLMTLGDPWSPIQPQFLFCIAFHVFVVDEHVETSNLVCRLIISSPNLRMTDCERGVVTLNNPF